VPRRRTLSALFLVACTSLFLNQVSAEPASIARVVLLDEAFAVVSELSSPRDLLEFSDAWSTKTETKLTSAQVEEKSFQYKLDLRASAGGGRWLYRTDGLVYKLDHSAKPVYRVKDVKQFNALLSIRAK
jgi:hypothetical protein